MAVISGNYQDSENFAGALKVFYSAKIVQTLNRDVVLRNRLQSMGKKKWNGLQHETSVHLRTSQAVGARPEGGYIPDAGYGTHQKAVISSKYNYCTVSVTGVADAQSSGSKGAWAQVKSENIQQAANDLSFDLGRQCYGSPEGILGVVKSYAGGVITLYGEGEDFGGTNTPPWGWRTSKNFRVGQNVVWGHNDADGGPPAAQFAAADPVGDGYGLVTAVADDGTFVLVTITKTGGNDPAGNDIVVRGDNTTAGKHAYGQEMEGLTSIVSATGNLHGISVSAYPEWAAKVFQNPATAGTKRPLTEQLLQHAIDKIRTRSNGKTDLAICHISTRNGLLYNLKAESRERYAPMKMEGGWSTLTYNAGDRPLSIVADRQARHHRLWLLDTRYLHTYEVLPFAWDQSNGSTWKWASGKDEMIAFGKTYSETGTTNRAAHGVIEDIAVSSFGVFE
jgi:hypothetical protein